MSADLSSILAGFDWTLDDDVQGPSPASPRRELASRAVDVDWDLVVDLRHRASAEITQNTEAWLADHARPMPADDRQQMGRSVITSVVSHHAEQIAANGQALWPRDVEHAYVVAVENADERGVAGASRVRECIGLGHADSLGNLQARIDGDGRHRDGKRCIIQRAERGLPIGE